jgi:hypothetical protein
VDNHLPVMAVVLVQMEVLMAQQEQSILVVVVAVVGLMLLETVAMVALD